MREVAAKQKQLDADAGALAKEEQAVRARGRAVALDDAAARQKAARKAVNGSGA